ncbi:segregation/condensation protein A [Vagococcus sp.]|uniref:segregation/condensation protein A n=1 Tax=Vagococcus sp. TaxID=1933889 RepID=UPI003F9C8D70
MNELNVKLAVFEGPLDLLLHLIKTLEIDIYDIPIAEITEQYMSYIQSMKSLDLEVAGEYIVMAATLMSIKSKMLLPQISMVLEEDDFLEEDPREALVNQLLEYRKYKYAAKILKEKEVERDHFYTKEPTNLDEYREDIPLLKPNEVTIIDLFLAFQDVVNRQEIDGFEEVSVTSENFTIEDKMLDILTRVKAHSTKDSFLFEKLFKVFTRSEVVVTFMALLELIKAGELLAFQENMNGPIQLACKKEIEV